MDFVVPPEDLLEQKLRFAVRVDRALGQRLVDGEALGWAECGARGGEDKSLHPGGHHGIQEVDPSIDVVTKIFGRIHHRLAHQRVGGEVHHGVGSGLAQSGGDLLGLLQVPENERHAGIDRFAVSLGEIVEYRHFMAEIEHLLYADAADIAGAAGNKNLHVLVFDGLESSNAVKQVASSG